MRVTSTRTPAAKTDAAKRTSTPLSHEKRSTTPLSHESKRPARAKTATGKENAVLSSLTRHGSLRVNKTSPRLTSSELSKGDGPQKEGKAGGVLSKLTTSKKVAPVDADHHLATVTEQVAAEESEVTEKDKVPFPPRAYEDREGEREDNAGEENSGEHRASGQGAGQEEMNSPTCGHTGTLFISVLEEQ
nr:hypothetical protein BaRGS_002103 [Batillaria attramentaria]